MYVPVLRKVWIIPEKKNLKGALSYKVQSLVIAVIHGQILNNFLDVGQGPNKLYKFVNKISAWKSRDTVPVKYTLENFHHIFLSKLYTRNHLYRTLYVGRYDVLRKQ